jgi:hypothetical protein
MSHASATDAVAAFLNLSMISWLYFMLRSPFRIILRGVSAFFCHHYTDSSIICKTNEYELYPSLLSMAGNR